MLGGSDVGSTPAVDLGLLLKGKTRSGTQGRAGGSSSKTPIITHLDPSHFALMAAQAALSMASAHRHWGRGEGEARTLQAVARQLARQDWTYEGNAPDVGAYEEIRGCGQKLVPLRAGPQTLSLSAYTTGVV